MLLALAASQPALARPAAKAVATAAPSSAQVEALERRAAESRARAAALAAKTARIEKDLAAQQQALTDTAADVRAGEETLSRLDAEAASLSETVVGRTKSLGQERMRLSDLAAGLVRLSRMPPGGLFAGFDRPIEAARAEMLIQAAAVAAHDSARRVEAELVGLDDAQRQLDIKKREEAQQAMLLKARQASLAGLVDKRQSLYQQTEADRQAETEKAQKIAEEAKDLRDLVARIEAQQKAEQDAEARRKAKMKAQRVPAPSGHFTAAQGLPVAGEVRIRFGQNDGLGTTSHGVTVIARPGATVTAPSAGTVRFAGPFRSYREILILEHPGGYLSLIAGLSRVSVTLGAAVAAGEPIGTMDDRADARPELYYELRRNGQFVDPEAVSPQVAVKGRAR